MVTGHLPQDISPETLYWRANRGPLEREVIGLVVSDISYSQFVVVKRLGKTNPHHSHILGTLFFLSF